MSHPRIVAFATAVGAALAFATSGAHATFVLDMSCTDSGCGDSVKFFNDAAVKDVSTFTWTVGGHSGQAVTVDTTGTIDTGAGFSTIKPAKLATVPLTDLLFTPAQESK